MTVLLRPEVHGQTDKFSGSYLAKSGVCPTAKRRSLADVVVHLPLVRRTILRRGVPESHVDDVVQETLICAWEKLQAGELQELARGFLAAWLTNVARFKAANFGRHRWVKELFADQVDDTVVDGSPGAEERLFDAANLDDVLAELKPVQREAILLNAYGYSRAEIAKLMGAPALTTRNRILQAREKIGAPSDP